MSGPWPRPSLPFYSASASLRPWQRNVQPPAHTRNSLALVSPVIGRLLQHRPCGVVPTCSHVHMCTVSHSHFISCPSKSLLFSFFPWGRLTPHRTLAILAQDVVEGFGHEVLEAEAMTAGAGVQRQRQLGREVARDCLATDAARRGGDLDDGLCR